MSRYDHLSRDALEARLKVAEDVCVLAGWSTLDFGRAEWEGSDRAEAAHQMWSIWCHMVGGSDALDPAKWPELDAMIPALSSQRRSIREDTLRRIREMGA
jgi:hypothetical protein